MFLLLSTCLSDINVVVLASFVLTFAYNILDPPKVL